MMQQMKAKTLNSVESFSNRKITVFSVYSSNTRDTAITTIHIPRTVPYTKHLENLISLYTFREIRYTDYINHKKAVRGWKQIWACQTSSFKVLSDLL